MAWAWAIGWALMAAGIVWSQVNGAPYGQAAVAYVSASDDLLPGYLLGFAGWGIGAAATLRFLKRECGATESAVRLGALGWILGALAAVPLGFHWLLTKDAGFLWFPFAIALGGALGGAFTRPPARASSAAHDARMSAAVRAIAWGGTFGVFQLVYFYALYVLMMMAGPLGIFSMFGGRGSAVLVETVPAFAVGYVAGHLGKVRLLESVSTPSPVARPGAPGV